MKLLYITSLFHKKGSSASIRNVSLVNGLVALGHEVTVLTLKYPREVLDAYLVENTDPTVSVIEVDSGYISRFVPNISPSIKKSFLQSIVAKIKSIIKSVLIFPDVDMAWIKSVEPQQYTGYDSIVSSSDTKTSHFVAKNIVAHNPTIQWIQIWGDPWFFDVGNTSYIKKIRSRKSERELLNLANKVFYVSLPTLNQMKDMFGLENGAYLPRGFLKSVPKSRVESDNLKMVYSGLLGGRNIEPIVQSIHSYNENAKIKISLEFYGRTEAEVVTKYSKYDFMTFHGQVSVQTILEVYQSTDILLFLGNAAHTTQIPGKLYDYFGTSCSILALVEDESSEVSKFIESTNRCKLYLNKVESILLQDLIEDVGTRSIVEDYSPQNIASLFISEIQKCDKL